MPDFMLILSLLYCEIFGGSALVLGHASEKQKTRASSWFQGMVNFFENQIFNQFYDGLWYFFKLHSSHKFDKDWRYDIIFFKLGKK